MIERIQHMTKRRWNFPTLEDVLRLKRAILHSTERWGEREGPVINLHQKRYGCDHTTEDGVKWDVTNTWAAMEALLLVERFICSKDRWPQHIQGRHSHGDRQFQRTWAHALLFKGKDMFDSECDRLCKNRASGKEMILWVIVRIYILGLGMPSVWPKAAIEGSTRWGVSIS